MPTVESRILTPFPAKSETEKAHELDPLRSEFMHHVMSPISHLAVVRTIDNFRSVFLSSLSGDSGNIVRNEADEIASHVKRTRYSGSGSPILESVGKKLHYIHETDQDAAVYPAWDLLTERQQSAATRFVSFTDPGAIGDDNNMLYESGLYTIREMLRMIYTKHPELELDDTEHMVSFLRNPLTPSILRGFAIGGNGFPASLTGGNRHYPAGNLWHHDAEKPVLDTSGDQPRTSDEIIDAAHTHRRSLREMPTDDLADHGAYGVYLRYSKGCPARFLHFRTDVQELRQQKLSFYPEQIADMMTDDQPIIEQIDDQGYRIVRDSYAEVLNTLADGVELLAH
jgi:hypothetical protein